MAEVCSRCRILPPQPDGIFIPITTPGVRHHSDCPEVPHLTPEDESALRERLRLNALARLQAQHNLRNEMP